MLNDGLKLMLFLLPMNNRSTMKDLPPMKKREKGFTLVEIILVVALIAVIGGMMVIIDPSFIAKNDVEVSGAVVTESLRRARILSTGSVDDSRWGVHIDEGSVIVFKGDSFSGRESEFDEVTAVSGDVSFSGINDVVFGKVRGEPSVTGDITVSSGSDYSIVISVNETGAVLH
jgi:prepilin-type N-terminal cleavage/methylation domain-containing protein